MKHAENFFIKLGYVHRGAGDCVKDSVASGGEIAQLPDVYALAGHIGRMFGCTHILDIGCGRGQKLVRLQPEFSLVGVDFASNINYCSSHYPFGQWLDRDLEGSHKDLLPQEILEKSIIVCSDVIEHLTDPTGLLLTLTDCLKHAPVAILTTPERDLVRGLDDTGPPANPAHVREWNQAELLQLLKAFSFDVAFTGLICNNDNDREKKTVLSILHGDNLPRRETIAHNGFRVVAFMTAYNEEDVIFYSIKRLLDAGIEVYLIDNWSSDSTVAAAEPLLGKGLIGIERFPVDGPTGTYDWRQLLTRVEELARTLPADWFIHHDVDEIRESPWPDLSLRDALQYVNRMGFNAIDHTVIDFRPVDNGFTSNTDFGNYFTYGEFGRRPGHFQQIKAWKNLGQPLTLAATGGHDVNFSGRRVFPYKFLLRHYPVRSQSHGDKKVLAERKPRFNPEERKLLGWHGHYDQIESGHNFLYMPESLNHFDPDRFYEHYLLERISGIGILRKNQIEPGKIERKGLFQRLKSLLGLSWMRTGSDT